MYVGQPLYGTEPQIQFSTAGSSRSSLTSLNANTMQNAITASGQRGRFPSRETRMSIVNAIQAAPAQDPWPAVTQLKLSEDDLRT
jgi:hypothetical protein